MAVFAVTVCSVFANLCINTCRISALSDNSIANNLLQLKEEITSDFETALAIEIKEAKNYLQQNDIQVKIQDLLFNELRKLQLN